MALLDDLEGNPAPRAERTQAAAPARGRAGQQNGVTDTFLSKLAARLKVKPGAYSAFAAAIRNWARWEGDPARHAFAVHNPLATTQTFSDLPLDTSFDVGLGPGIWNGAGDGGVKVYATEDAGVEATARMIENGNFPTLLGELRSGAPTARSIPELRLWGTTGYANELAGGSGDGDGGGPAPIDVNDPSGMADILDQLAAALAANRPSQNDPLITSGQATYSDLVNEWVTNYGSLVAQAANLRELADGYTTLQDGTVMPLASATPEQLAKINADYRSAYQSTLRQYNMDQAGLTTSDFSNKLNAIARKTDIGELNRSTAATKVSRALSGLGESRARAEMITKARQDASGYAYPESEGGRAITIDPESLLNQWDTTFGVTGALPDIPDSGLSINDVPNAPDLDQYRLPPPTDTLSGRAVRPKAAAVPALTGANSPLYAGRSSTFGSGPVPQGRSKLDEVTAYEPPSPRSSHSSDINDRLRSLAALARFYGTRSLLNATTGGAAGTVADAARNVGAAGRAGRSLLSRFH